MPAPPLRACVVMFASMAICVACKGPGASKLEGTWKGVRAEGISASDQAKASAFALATQLTVHGNQIAISSPAGSEASTYVVRKETEGTVVVSSQADGAASEETLDVSEDGLTLTWHVDRARTIVFAKLEQ